MKDKGTQFYADNGNHKGLAGLLQVDDGTHYVTIPTPKGWKCKKKGCTTEVKHKHGTYASLNNTSYDK